MIKFNHLIGLQRFSTVRFPERYQQAFKLSKEIKGCLTLTDLSNYIDQNDPLIKKYAKTSILEYLN